MTKAPRAHVRRHLAGVMLVSAFMLGCGSLASPTTTRNPTAGPANANSCEEAFGAWVELAEQLNAPGADLAGLLFQQEQIERRVFELCTLERAEALNRDRPVEIAPGVKKPLIEPDFRTFADVECVDESPLLDGTPLCAEVGH